MTVIVVLTMVVVGYAICRLISINMKKADARSKNKYIQLSELGSRYNLSFSSHLVLKNKILALDGIKNSLLILETNKPAGHTSIIELNSVAVISLKKSYRSIKAGELKHKELDDFLTRIDLQFEYNSKTEIIVLSFYDCETDDPQDIPRLARDAQKWQTMLSKIIGARPDKMAKGRNKLSMV